MSTLLRQELELAKSELREEAGKAGMGAGLLGTAGVAGLLVAVFASLALTYALAAVMPSGWAALVVAVLWAIVGLEQLKEDVRWAKHPTT